MPPTITGIKPTGLPHLGNYLGMIRPALDLARTGDALCFIAGYHALTTLPPPDSVRQRPCERPGPGRNLDRGHSHPPGRAGAGRQ